MNPAIAAMMVGHAGRRQLLVYYSRPYNNWVAKITAIGDTVPLVTLDSDMVIAGSGNNPVEAMDALAKVCAFVIGVH